MHEPMSTLSLTKQARIYNREKTASSINGTGKPDSDMQKKIIKLEHFLTLYTLEWVAIAFSNLTHK